MTSVRELKMMVELGNRQAKVNNELLGWLGTSTNTAQQDSLLIEDRDPDDLIEDLTGEDLDYDIEHDMTAQTEIQDSLEKIMRELTPELEKRAEAKAVRNFPYTYKGKKMTYPVPMLVVPRIVAPNVLGMSVDEMERANAELEALRNRVGLIIQENERRTAFNDGFNDRLQDMIEEVFATELEKQKQILTGLYKEKRINEAKALNIGERSTAQYPNESNEDYVARIAMINQSLPDKDTIIAQQRKKQRLKLISSMKSVATPVDAEEIVRDFSDDEVIILNRTIKAFLEDVRKKYTKLDVKTFQILGHTWVRRVEKMTTGTGSVMADLQDDAVEVIASGGGRPTIAEMERVEETTAGELAPPADEGLAWKEIEALLLAREGSAGGKRTKAEWLEKLREVGLIGEPRDEDRKGRLSFDPYLPNIGAREIVKKLTKDLFEINNKRYKVDKLVPDEYAGLGMVKGRKKAQMRAVYTQKKIIEGKGIAIPRKDEQYVQFGKFLIDEPRLKNGVLRVIYHSTGVSHPDFRPQDISTDLRDEITTMIETGKWSERALKHLDKGEQTTLKKLLEKSGVAQAMGIKELQTDEMKEDTNRWELLKGELRIGNNSPRIIKEMEQLIKKFMENGRIKKQEGYKLLYELKSFV